MVSHSGLHDALISADVTDFIFKSVISTSREGHKQREKCAYNRKDHRPPESPDILLI